MPKNSANKALIIPDNKEIKQNFIKSLPFSLTNAQLRSIEEVSSDLEKDKPMLRLLHGDVGSGKTMIAVFAALQVSASGNQCVILAPTELLAQQHYNKIKKLLDPFKVNTVLLTSSVKGSKRDKIVEDIKTGVANFNLRLVINR